MRQTKIRKMWTKINIYNKLVFNQFNILFIKTKSDQDIGLYSVKKFFGNIPFYANKSVKKIKS